MRQALDLRAPVPGNHVSTAYSCLAWQTWLLHGRLWLLARCAAHLITIQDCQRECPTARRVLVPLSSVTSWRVWGRRRRPPATAGRRRNHARRPHDSARCRARKTVVIVRTCETLAFRPPALLRGGLPCAHRNLCKLRADSEHSVLSTVIGCRSPLHSHLLSVRRMCQLTHDTCVAHSRSLASQRRPGRCMQKRSSTARACPGFSPCLPLPSMSCSHARSLSFALSLCAFSS